MAQRAERSSADDCAIFVLAGRELLGWGEEKPKFSLNGGFANQAGRQAYVLDCPWRELGVVPPDIRLGVPRPQDTREPLLSRMDRTYNRGLGGGTSATMSRPKYDPAGLIAGNTVYLWKGGGATPEAAIWECGYVKYAGKWMVSKCLPASVCYTGVFFGNPPPGTSCEPVKTPIIPNSRSGN